MIDPGARWWQCGRASGDGRQPRGSGQAGYAHRKDASAVPAHAETFNATEKIIGNWLAARPGMRQKLVIAAKVAGPSRECPGLGVAVPIENGLDETLHRLGVSLLAYSPLAFGLLTGKYDASGTDGEGAPAAGRMAKFEAFRKQRWGRPEAVTAAVRYNQQAVDNGLTPTQLALAFCYTKWQVASTIIGVTSLDQLDQDLDAWGTTLSPQLLKQIDTIRWEHRDPAQ